MTGPRKTVTRNLTLTYFSFTRKLNEWFFKAFKKFPSDLLCSFRSIIISNLKIAARCSNEELSGQFSIKNKSAFRDFGDSHSEQAIDDNIYGYPNNVERRNFAENDEDIGSASSDFDSNDNQNVDVNRVPEIVFINEDTVDQVFISNERADASTNTTSNPSRPWKRQRATTGTQNQARHLQQQPPQFNWNQNNSNNTVPEFRLKPLFEFLREMQYHGTTTSLSTFYV